MGNGWAVPKCVSIAMSTPDCSSAGLDGSMIRQADGVEWSQTVDTQALSRSGWRAFSRRTWSACNHYSFFGLNCCLFRAVFKVVQSLSSQSRGPVVELSASGVVELAELDEQPTRCKGWRTGERPVQVAASPPTSSLDPYLAIVVALEPLCSNGHAGAFVNCRGI